MLTKVDIATVRGTLLTLPLDDVEHGYIVNEIEGLDPVKATLVSSSVSGQDGAKYHSSKRETRNIKMHISYAPDYVSSTVTSLRKTLYSFFLPKSHVFLRFYDDNGLTVTIDGYVESFDGPLFVKDPDANISLICYDPDFINPVPVSSALNTVADSTITPIAYPGDVETGIELIVAVNRSMTAFTVYNTGPDAVVQQLDFAAALVAGDSVRISTVPGAKGAWLTRAGVISSVLYGVSAQSKWIELLGPGTNNFRVYATGAAVPYTLNHSDRYGGL